MTDRPLRILIVSGIWPPDVGGPASHGPALGEYLASRGHRVSALVSTDKGVDAPFPLHVVRRDRPLPVRMAAGAVALVRHARDADVVYATGIYHRAAAAAHAVRRPLVIKLVNDPAYERAKTRGWFTGGLEEFQAARGNRPIRALRRARDAALRRAATIIVPSAYLAAIVGKWDLGGTPVEVVHNPAVVGRAAGERQALRAELGMDGLAAVFVPGRRRPGARPRGRRRRGRGPHRPRAPGAARLAGPCRRLDASR
jgi:hypothetical protein